MVERCSPGILDDHPHLQADEQEHRVLQQELDRAPVGPLGDPRGRALPGRRPVAEDQAGHHDRDDAAGVDLLGRQVSQERRQERHRGVEHRIGDAAAQHPQNLRHHDAR